MCLRFVHWLCQVTSPISPLASKLLKKTPFLYRCHHKHTVTILTTLALEFLGSYLFLWRNNGFFQPSALPLCPTLSFSLLLPSSSSASLHPWNADFRPQGLKSGWRGANYHGKETKTRRGGERRGGGGEEIEGEKDRCREGRRGEAQHCCSLAEERQKKNKETNTEKWRVHFP